MGRASAGAATSAFRFAGGTSLAGGADGILTPAGLRKYRCSRKINLVNLFLTNLVRISGFSSLFSAIAMFLALSGKKC